MWSQTLLATFNLCFIHVESHPGCVSWRRILGLVLLAATFWTSEGAGPWPLSPSVQG